MLKKFRIFLLFLSIFSLIRAEIPEGYYPATLNGKKERELKTAFHLLLKDHTRIGYGGGMGGTWSVFRYSDAKSGGNSLGYVLQYGTLLYIGNLWCDERNEYRTLRTEELVGRCGRL